MPIHISAALVPRDLSGDGLKSKTAVVIDVLRATSTIVTALENGAAGVIPVGTPEAALTKKKTLEQESVLIGGERGGLRCEGFDLGNSPREYTAQKVEGRRIVFTSTNGSAMMLMCRPAKAVRIAAFLNAKSVAERIAEDGRDCLIACAGDHGRFSLEDTGCAGMIVSCLREITEIKTDDETRAAELLYKSHQNDIQGMMKQSVHGRRLMKLGFEKDIEFCAQADTTKTVPFTKGDEIVKD